MASLFYLRALLVKFLLALIPAARDQFVRLSNIIQSVLAVFEILHVFRVLPLKFLNHSRPDFLKVFFSEGFQ